MMDLVIHLDRLTRDQRADILDLVNSIYTSQEVPKMAAPDLSDISLELDVPDPAAVFGGAVAQVPPSPTVPAVPPAPVNTPALPTPPNDASSPPTAAAPPAPIDAPAGSVVTDVTGLPWDSRIHSSSKAKNADGTWRSKRGFNDEALRKQIEGELRRAMAASPASLFVPQPPAAAPQPPAVAPLTVVPQPPAVVPPPPQDVVDFPSFMKWLTPLMSAAKLTNQSLISALGANGLDSLPALATRVDLVPAVHMTLSTLVGV